MNYEIHVVIPLPMNNSLYPGAIHICREVSLINKCNSF